MTSKIINLVWKFILWFMACFCAVHMAFWFIPEIFPIDYKVWLFIELGLGFLAALATADWQLLKNFREARG